MPKKILVVEDDPAIQNAIVMKLKKEGMETYAATSVSEAKKVLEEQQSVDAIWLDHYLYGEGDGLDFLRQIKQNDKFKDIPVFVISNTINPEKVKPYFELGAVKFYVKSDFRLEEIVDDIKSIWAE